MKANLKDLILTRHVKERFIERTDPKYRHLQHCTIENCVECYLLRGEIEVQARMQKVTITQAIHDRIADAKEDRSHINNTSFMDWYYRKYGYDNRFEFLVDKDLVFVIIHDDGKRKCVTCVSSKTHHAGKRQFSRKKFRKKQPNAVTSDNSA